MADLPNADNPGVRLNAVVAAPNGLDPAKSEVMIGAKWQKLVAFANLAVKFGVLTVPDNWLALAGDPLTVEMVVLGASCAIDGVNWFMACFIERGRINAAPDGTPQALSPLKESVK